MMTQYVNMDTWINMRIQSVYYDWQVVNNQWHITSFPCGWVRMDALVVRNPTRAQWT